MLTDEEIMAQVLAAFYGEQAEHCQAIIQLLFELEQNPVSTERKTLVDCLFREAHSLKGGARAAGQLQVEQLAHAMEDIFSAVRQQQCVLTPANCDPIYAALETINAIMAQVAANRPISIPSFDEVMRRLAAIVAEDPPATSDLHVPHEQRANDAPNDNESGAVRTPEPRVHDGRFDTASVRIPVATLDTLLNETGELLAYTVRSQQRTLQAQHLTSLPLRWRRTARQVRSLATRMQAQGETLQPTVHYLEGRQNLNTPLRPLQSGRWADHEVLALANAVVQADVLMRDLERQLAAHVHEAREDHSRLATVTNRLYDQIRRTRMLPVSTLLNPLRLQVRDMARAADKQALVVMDDGAAEADRQVLEILRNVLLHLMRNAVDHGIEAPAVRLAANKPPEGRISVISRVSGDRLHLIIEDDGAGINREAILQRAQAMKIHSDTELAAMSDSEVLDLIFLAGFSTSATVNALSGRGVGLDIVRTQVQRIQGHITIQSVPTQGTRFDLRVPLSLTSAQSLLLKVGQDQYVVPLDAVHHILAVQPNAIFVVEGQSTITYQGIPTLIVRLEDILGGQATASHFDTTSTQPRMAVVLGAADRRIACIVDGIISEQEIVIHRLPAPLRRVRFISSATILPDGAVVPILDVVDIVRGALGIRYKGLVTPPPVPAHQKYRVLVVDDSLTTRTLQKNILEAAGYSVTLASDGVEALATLHAMSADGGCDVLLSDVDMPRLNGFELTTQIRATEQLSHLPIILVTSLDTDADRERGITAGADAYIVKRNFDQQVLLDTIKQLI